MIYPTAIPFYVYANSIGVAPVDRSEIEQDIKEMTRNSPDKELFKTNIDPITSFRQFSKENDDVIDFLNERVPVEQ